MAEPFVTLTDFAITLQTFAFAIWLWRGGTVERLWALAFAAVGVAALLGGSYHGFGEGISYFQQLILWQGMVVAVSLASFFMLVAASWSFPPPWRYGWLILSTLKLACFLWAWDDFPWLFAPRVADYLMTLIVVAVLWRRQNPSHPSQGWLIAGVAISILAVLLLIATPSEVAVVNALVAYHLVSIVSLFCIFWGVRLRFLK